MVDKDDPWMTGKQAVEFLNDAGLFMKINEVIKDGLDKAATLKDLDERLITGDLILEMKKLDEWWIRVKDVEIIFDNIKTLVSKYVEAIRS